MADLLKKKVKISDPYILQFFYPHFTVTSCLSNDVDYSQGVIYTGIITESVIKRIDNLSGGNYILVSDFSDIQLETPSDYIKIFFPVLEDKKDKYSNYALEDFIPLMKVYYILQKRIPLLKEEELNIYSLFDATVQPSQLDAVYFNLLKESDIKILISSFLSFLIKVNEEDYTKGSDSYKKLINKAHTRYGIKIKNAIRQYIESEQIPELSFWNLLHALAG